MKVLIVGAGPAGLLLGLLLAKDGIEVQLLEANDYLDAQPRACHYAPNAVLDLIRAPGVLDDCRAVGFTPDGVSWRKKDGSLITSISNGDIPQELYDVRMVCLPLNLLSGILLKHLEKQPTAEVRWKHKVVKQGEDSAKGKAWVVAQKAGGEEEKFEADYVVGCDGANSQVRRSLFGDWEFPGWTWDKQIVATNIYYDFRKFGWIDANFIVHPDDWFMAAKITPDGMWRVTYGDKFGLSNEEYKERLPMRFKELLPGAPEPDQYKLVSMSPYKIHQRLATRMRVGRFLLAADAAHLCNPFGGLGLTGGIIDVGGLYDCLIGIYRGVADESILDKYDEVRREKYNTITDPVSCENFKRLWDQDPDKCLENDVFFQMCQRASTDKEFAKQMQMAAMGMRHDFTQYYNKLSEGKANGTTAAEVLEVAVPQ